MPCCDTGRNIQKYKGAAASTLQDVTDNGNTTTGDIITTSGFFIGDGSKLTGISGASAAFTLQETSDRGNTTSNVIQFTNTITSLTTSGNVIVAGNVTASTFYGDGTTLTGVALSADLADNVTRIGNLESNLTNNSTRISILESNLADNVTRIGNLESNLTNNSTRISILESNLADNVTRIGNLESNLTNNSTRISILESNLTNNSTRISILESNLADNVTRISILESNLADNVTRISILESNLADNVTRIGNLESNLTNNSTRISILESNLADNVTRIGNLESNLVSNASRISTLEIEIQPVTRGGTGFTSYGIGDILYASAPSTLSNLAPSTAGHFLRTNGTGNTPTWASVADIGSATPANLYTDDYITGGPWSGLTDANIRVLGNVSNLSNQLVARDDKGDIFVSNVNAIKYYGDGGTLSNISGSQGLQDVINQNPYTNSPPYFGNGSYGAIYGSNTINASTISTTIGVYGPIKGSNTITASTISTTTGFYGPIKGSNTITTSGVYGPIYGSNTVTASTISTTTGFYGPIKGSNTITASSIVSDNAVGLNQLNASNINSGTLSNVYGGTGFTSYNPGDLLVGTNTNNLKKLSKGSANQVLTVKSDNSDIEWAAASSGGSSLWTQLGNQDIYYNSGNVGIQTNTPQYELDVSGNVNITQKLLVNGTPGITGNVLGINSTSSGLEWVKAPDKVKVTANDTSTYQHKIIFSLAPLSSDGESTYTDLNSQSIDLATNDIFSFTPSESLLEVGVIRTGRNNSNNSISNLNPTHTLHVGDKIIMHNFANYDVFRVNGNVFTTGHFVGDGSYITGIKQIKNETDTDVIVAGDGAPTRRSLLSRFYN
jgi:predicted  nucleic acid-binding Zn-ribbon protein